MTKNFYRNVPTIRKFSIEPYIRFDYDAHLHYRDYYESYQPEIYSGRVGVFFFRKWCITSIFIYNPNTTSYISEEKITTFNAGSYISNLFFIRNNFNTLSKLNKLRFDYF